jgi:hypothetical protein
MNFRMNICYDIDLVLAAKLRCSEAKLISELAMTKLNFIFQVLCTGASPKPSGHLLAATRLGL